MYYQKVHKMPNKSFQLIQNGPVGPVGGFTAVQLFALEEGSTVDLQQEDPGVFLYGICMFLL